MFADNTVFSKTALGQKELTNTQLSKLPRTLRNFLILVDGQKTFAQYKKALGDSRLLKSDATLEDYFKALQDLNLIKPKGAEEKARAPAVVATPVFSQQPRASKPAASRPPTQNVEHELKFKELHSLIIECVEQELSAFNWEATLELERCQTPAQLRAAISNIFEKNKSELSRDGKKTLKNTYKALARLKPL
jgi:hypothetical protein